MCFILLLSLPNHFLYLAISCAENFYELTAAEPSIEGLLRRYDVPVPLLLFSQ